MNAGRRPVCARCERPTRACMCGWVRPVDNRVELLLLQHPLERHEAKNSARLLHLSLARSRLQVGERFEPAALALPARSLLLYPDDPRDPAPAPDPAWFAEPQRLCLVLLDATWRKSRKMLHLNPVLRALPRLSLAPPPVSRYAIRKAHAPHQRSTFEAGLLALRQLEGDADRYAPLWAGFDGFVAALQARAAAGR